MVCALKLAVAVAGASPMAAKTDSEAVHLYLFVVYHVSSDPSPVVLLCAMSSRAYCKTRRRFVHSIPLWLREK